MRSSATEVRRVLRQRGVREFLGDVAAYLTENELAPYLDPWFEYRALYERDLSVACSREGTFFEHYDSAESYVLDLPTTPGGYSEEEAAYMQEVYGSGMHIDAPWVCELADVDLVGPDAIPVKNGGYVFENFFYSTALLTTSCLMSAAHGTLPRGGGDADADVDAAVSLVGPWNYNYTHWFQDYLARLEGLEYFEQVTGVEPAILIPSDASGWMLDALRATGVDPDRWVEWDGGRVRVERFVVPAIRREERGYSPRRRILYSPTGIEWLRDRIAANVEPERTVPHSSRIYVSRENAIRRRVVNEEATMELLSGWGFERYRAETLSFAEQVTLFSEADVIVGPHGSGLMNQIWAEDATVVEIFGPKQGITAPASEYYYAEMLGHDYGCVQGDTVGPDVRVDLEALERLLEAMLDE